MNQLLLQTKQVFILEFQNPLSNLYHHIDVYGDPPSRTLFDVGAIVVVKNLEWADSTSMPAPAYVDNQWIDRAGNSKKSSSGSIFLKMRSSPISIGYSAWKSKRAIINSDINSDFANLIRILAYIKRYEPII